MTAQPEAAPVLALEGEVVEIFERAGRRIVKIVLEPRAVVDVAAADTREMHLGDRVVVSGVITIDEVSPGASAKTL